MVNHVTVGVYPSENFKVNVVKPEHLEGHIEYNVTLRPGRALFVDGKCKYKGSLNDEKVEKWEKKIQEMNINNTKVSEIYW